MRPYRTWLSISIGIHALLLALAAFISLPAPSPGAAESLVPVAVMDEPAPPRLAPKPEPKPVIAPKPEPKPVVKPAPKPAPKPVVVRPRPAPQPKPAAAPKPVRQVARAPRTPARTPGIEARPGRGNPAGAGTSGPGMGTGGPRRGPARTSPAPPAVMRTAGGKGKPAPPGTPGGSGTQGTGTQGTGTAGGGEPDGPTTGAVSLGGRAPSYPKLAEEAGDEGTVVVTVSINASGEVESATVSSSSGHETLDAAALRAARNWRFKPALRKGKPVAATERIRFHFANGRVTGE